MHAKQSEIRLIFGQPFLKVDSPDAAWIWLQISSMSHAVAGAHEQMIV